MLVNDDLFFSGRLVSVLAKQGFEVSVVQNETDAIESVKQDDAQLVIVNANSRKIDAPELIATLRTEASVGRIIAFISHTRIPETRKRILEAGADRLCANSAITMRLPEIIRSVLAGESTVSKVEE